MDLAYYIILNAYQYILLEKTKAFFINSASQLPPQLKNDPYGPDSWHQHLAFVLKLGWNYIQLALNENINSNHVKLKATFA